MYRSWGYILMFAATLAGVVALLWPTPPVRTIEEIAMPTRPAPARPEPPAKQPKQASKPPAPKPPPAKPAPPAVVGRMPQQNTTTRRGAAVPENGLQPNTASPSRPGVPDRGPPPPKPVITPRPVNPSSPPPPPSAPPDAAP